MDSAILVGKRADIPLIGVRELIRNKEAMGRPKDLDDLMHPRQAGGRGEQ